jgi:hypothetical protein
MLHLAEQKAEARIADLVAAEESMRRQLMRERQERRFKWARMGCMGGDAAQVDM